MAKKRIPGPMYIIIGAAMILMSVFIDIEKLAAFIFIGAVFIVIGFFKILIKEKESAKYHAAHHAAQHAAHAGHAAHKPAHQPAHPQHKQTPHLQQTSIVRCSGCGVKIHPLFKWCPNCGHKLK